MAIFRSSDKIIFFAHVPRCAGTSVEAHVRKRFGPPAFLDTRYRRNKAKWTVTSPNHVHLDALKQLFPSGFFDHVFAVVRHPEDRLRSAFLFQRDVEKTIDSETDFDRFLDRLQRPRFRNRPKFDNHFRPQSELVPEDAKTFAFEDGIETVLKHIDNLAGVEALHMDIPHRLPTNTKLAALTDAQIAKIHQIYAVDYQRFGYVPGGGRVPASQDEAKNTIGETINLAIKTSVGLVRNREKWGDWHYAKSLADALTPLGYNVRIDCKPQWQRAPEFADVDLVLRGSGIYKADANKAHMIWVLYPGRKPSAEKALLEEMDHADHVAVSSPAIHRQLTKNSDLSPKVSLMLQAFDEKSMWPSDGDRHGVVFVGNNHQKRLGHPLRPIVKMALDAECSPCIYGPGYENTNAAPFVKSDFVANTELGNLYRSAQAVLCDHIPVMRDDGYLSNRIFDALACGAPVICDDVTDLPDEFRNHVFPCKSIEDFGAALTQIENETDDDRKSRQDFARTEMMKHTFSARAKQIDETIRSVLQRAKKSA
ncbi:sulfotransferase family 2 domain-containing protein [Aliiroseovarius sp. KMU-50]|uniref:Sulfotransferase family 2 domain-containing protein n=1 Tax=Aliiroseovarius salicola TaxID=3009082 RepID=A0ABT4W3R1_9RHOB|nr:sulfotransferase family 2 domain-containing protein [Aliiroseovarius sp. KMU-50]MDA5095167.1 sulfotransferase family 2 domain-containing protein [Aliiroseovarius sp. KMU-50]